MVFTTTTNKERRMRRHRRVRAKIVGTAERPRLAVFRSAKHITTQLIDDASGTTLVAASDTHVNVRSGKDESKSMATARAVGRELAKRAGAAGIMNVVFDRGGFAYHGRVKALAEAAREEGLRF